MAKLTTSSSIDVKLETIQHDIDEIKGMIKDQQRILTGKDGTPGLVGNFALLREKVCAIEIGMNNDMKHMSARMDMMFDSRDRLQMVSDKDVITGSQVLKEWIKPIIVTILTAILTYFIVTSGLAQ